MFQVPCQVSRGKACGQRFGIDSLLQPRFAKIALNFKFNLLHQSSDVSNAPYAKAFWTLSSALLQEASQNIFDLDLELNETGGVTLVTHTDYFPNVNAWLVRLPARTWVTDGGGTLLSESLTLYDGANLYTTPPTVGIPTASRSLIDPSLNRYRQTSMTRDAWGNVTSQTTWSGYGTRSTAPTSGARTSYTTSFWPLDILFTMI